MNTLLKTATCLTPLCLGLAACSSPEPMPSAPKKQAAHLTVIADVSISSETMTANAYGQAVQKRVGEAVSKMRLGDSITVVEVGARSSDRAVSHPTIVTDNRLRLPAARKLVLKQMQEITARLTSEGADRGSKLLLALESNLICTPGSKILVLSDGIEEGGAYSVGDALAASKPIELPPPAGPILRGCSVQFLGFGVTKNAIGDGAQVLLDSYLVSLRRGWTNYLRSAGVNPADITFTTVM
jgi:hypothetical protein